LKRTALLLLFLTCFISRIGNAGEVTVESLCRFLLEPPSSSEASDPGENVTYGQWFKYILNRDQSVSIGYLNQRQIVEMKDGVTLSERVVHDRRVVIFTLGKKWQTEKRDPDTLRETWDQAYWAAVKLERDISGLKKESTVHSCIARAGHFGVTDETLERTQKLIDAAKDLQREELERASFKIAQESLHNYEHAELVPIESIEEISAYLQTSRDDTRGLDLLFVLHASDEGLLLDASGAIVPRPFFRKLGQDSRINSIAIFSCFPRRVATFYGSAFEQLNASGIQIFFPIEKIHFGEQNTVPLDALDVFIEKHARALSAPMSLNPHKNPWN